MRKGLFLLGATAAVLSSCSNQEVMDVADYANQPIEFSTFVNNATRADNSVMDDNFTKFWALSQFHAQNSQDQWVDAFKNVGVSKVGTGATANWVTEQTYYWSAGDTYRFAAYADGTNKLDDAIVKYTAGDSKLSFTGYTAGANDLVAAFGAEDGYTWDGQAGDDVPPVALTFNHLLSKVTFTFKTKLADTYTIQVSQIKVKAVKTTNGDYIKGNTAPSWTTAAGTPTADYEWTPISDVASGTLGADGYFTVMSDPQFVIPQGNNDLEVSFTVSLWDQSQTVGVDSPIQNTFTASLKYTAPSTSDGTTSGQWTAGYHYNYTGEITMDNIDPDGNQKPITFTVTTVNGWETAGGETEDLIPTE